MNTMSELKELIELLISEEAIQAVKVFQTDRESIFLVKLQRIRELGEALRMIKQIE